MQYTYEFEMWRGEKQWIIAPFDLPDITQGVDVEDACESAADLLREIIWEYLMHGKTPPTPTFDNKLEHDGVRVVVSVEASLDGIRKVSASEAARMLSVSRSRITAMLNSHLLEGWRDGRNTWITLDSVNARLEEAHPSGRPRKKVAAE